MSEANKWEILSAFKIKFVSPRGHVISSISWKEDRAFVCFDGSLVSEERVLHLWFSFYSWPDNRPTKMLCNCGNWIRQAILSIWQWSDTKSIGQRIDLWGTTKCTLAWFEQSGNDYLGSWSPEKGLKEKMEKSFVIRWVFFIPNHLEYL